RLALANLERDVLQGPELLLLQLAAVVRRDQPLGQGRYEIAQRVVVLSPRELLPDAAELDGRIAHAGFRSSRRRPPLPAERPSRPGASPPPPRRQSRSARPHPEAACPPPCR